MADCRLDFIPDCARTAQRWMNVMPTTIWRTHGPLRILRGHFELASSALAVAVCLHVGRVDSAVEVERRERKCVHDKEARF
jgi:hypothetical protein